MFEIGMRRGKDFKPQWGRVCPATRLLQTCPGQCYKAFSGLIRPKRIEVEKGLKWSNYQNHTTAVKFSEDSNTFWERQASSQIGERTECCKAARGRFRRNRNPVWSHTGNFLFTREVLNEFIYQEHLLGMSWGLHLAPVLGSSIEPTIYVSWE